MLRVAADALFGPNEAIICLQNDLESRDRTRCRETLVKAVRKGIESYPKLVTLVVNYIFRGMWNELIEVSISRHIALDAFTTWITTT